MLFINEYSHFKMRKAIWSDPARQILINTIVTSGLCDDPAVRSVATFPIPLQTTKYMFPQEAMQNCRTLDILKLCTFFISCSHSLVLK